MPPTKSSKKSGNPAVRNQPPQVEETKYAPSVWGAGGVGGMEDLVVPSGQLCLVRRPGVSGLIAAGVLHQVDSLTSLVDKKHIVKGKPGEDDSIDTKSLMSDPESLENVMNVVDRVACYCVVKPEIHRTPDDITRREPGVIYADMVDIIDRMFIFAFVVGGTRDLETFRSGLDEAMGGLETGEGVPDEAQPDLLHS